MSEISSGNASDAGYDAFLKRIQARFLSCLELGKQPLFTTDANAVFAAYLDSFPAEKRQYHNCHACRDFFQRFGTLVTIADDGATATPFWDESDAPAEYVAGITAIATIVRKAKVTGVFLTSKDVWGQPTTGTWSHYSVKPPKSLIFNVVTRTAVQAMAEKAEEFRMVTRALLDFTSPMIAQAVTLLKTDSLYRSEKVLGQAEWLAALHAARDAVRGPAVTNVTWKAVATAPAGYCHPRSSMIGTLLEDISAGMTFNEVARRFAAKMHPLQYQRPHTALAAGAIAAAEKIVEQLGTAGALARRYCRVDEVKAIWKPAEHQEKKTKGGLFGHLLPKKTPSLPAMMPAITMTWTKFAATVLPEAERIEYFASATRTSYSALVTAVHPDSPPIFQWDLPGERNPVSWYVWHGGSTPEEFSLKSNQWHHVSAITLKPSMWGTTEFSHHGKAVLFILDGGQETKSAGAAIFPEFMKSEYHSIRSVIEAYSKGEKIQGQESPHAIGLMLDKSSAWNEARFRVSSKGQVVEYHLDRWD